MKLQNVLTVLALLIGLNASAYVGEPKIKKSGNKSFVVDLADWSTFDVRVKIADISGRVILSEKVSSSPGKIYNLKNLPTGGYIVTVSNDVKSLTTNMEIIGNRVVILEDKVFYKPVITKGDDFFNVNVLTQKQPVSVALMSNGETVFSKSYSNVININQRFSTAKLKSGVYTVVVNKGGKITSEVIRK